jgi:DNA-binding beta-propeller fold protein YncE
MNILQQRKQSAIALILVIAALTGASRLVKADTATCGGASTTLPFTDVPSSNVFFCAIAEAYFSGLTNGTSPTTYSPSDTVSREQMAAFVTRTQDSALKRGNRRAALGQWWTPTSAGVLRSTAFTGPNNSYDIVCDGDDLWISHGTEVKRVDASDGKILQTWTAPTFLTAIIAAAGRIFVASSLGNSPGKIYVINPEAAPGPMTVFEDDIGAAPLQMTFDGTNLWTANFTSTGVGSISRIDVATGIDSTFSAGLERPYDILWDGASLWVADGGNIADTGGLKRIDPANGSVLNHYMDVGSSPGRLLFDGTNIWVASRINGGNALAVVRAVGGLRGTVLKLFSGGNLNGPVGMAFDGERVLVCNYDGDTVSLFKAADLTPLGTLSTGPNSAPWTACNDGVNFWIIRIGNNDIVRF